VSGKFLQLFTSMAAMAIVASCSSSDMGSTFKFGQKKEEQPEVATNQPLIMQGTCPQVFLREGTAIFREYTKGTKKDQNGMADPDKLVVQATLGATTRQCIQTAEGLKVKVVVHGRLVTGPAGKPGTYTLPIRVAATDGDTTLYSELTKFQVTLPPGEGSTQFIFAKDDVLLTRADGLTRLYAGIDEGPYNTR
jgi:hypothetical protein